MAAGNHGGAQPQLLHLYSLSSVVRRGTLRLLFLLLLLLMHAFLLLLPWAPGCAAATAAAPGRQRHRCRLAGDPSEQESHDAVRSHQRHCGAVTTAVTAPAATSTAASKLARRRRQRCQHVEWVEGGMGVGREVGDMGDPQPRSAGVPGPGDEGEVGGQGLTAGQGAGVGGAAVDHCSSSSGCMGQRWMAGRGGGGGAPRMEGGASRRRRGVTTRCVCPAPLSATQRVRTHACRGSRQGRGPRRDTMQARHPPNRLPSAVSATVMSISSGPGAPIAIPDAAASPPPRRRCAASRPAW